MERVTQVRQGGGKAISEFWLRGRLTGRAFWDSGGSLCMAVGLRDGVPVGYQLEYCDGALMYAEPFMRGVVHGLAKQFDTQGRLLLVSPFKKGTGTDFWCDEHGCLSEEHSLVEGKPSGTERWWNPDQKTIYCETEWLNGKWHGATRYWTDGRLDRGFPRFFVRGRRVSKRAYMGFAEQDASLPPYLQEADSPVRTLPKRFLELKERARRLRRGRTGPRR